MRTIFPLFHYFFVTLFCLLVVTFKIQGESVSVNHDSLHITVSDGTELFVSVRGHGIPCLYIHGGPGVGSYWMEKIYGDVLEKHFKMIYLDQRGSGRSGSAATGDYSPERMAQDFEEVRRQLGIDSWITFSHSFGGLLQMKHAELYPQTIRGMLMVEATLNLEDTINEMIPKALDLMDIKGEERYPYLDESKDPITRVLPIFDMLREKNVFWKLYYADQKNETRMDSIMANGPQSNSDFANHAFGIPGYFENYKPMTANLTMPVLFFYGMHDYAIGPHHYKNIQFPNMTLVSWNGGHVPFMEGRSELETAITQWLQAEHLE